MVALRLICPVTVESRFSLIPDRISSGQIIATMASEYVGDVDIIHENDDGYDSAVAAGRQPVFSENGDALYVIDQLADSSHGSTDESWLENIALREAVRTLTPREQKIISLRYYKDKTQMEIAAEIGISQAQVSRVEKAALEKLRKQL